MEGFVDAIGYLFRGLMFLLLGLFLAFVVSCGGCTYLLFTRN